MIMFVIILWVIFDVIVFFFFKQNSIDNQQHCSKTKQACKIILEGDYFTQARRSKENSHNWFCIIKHGKSGKSEIFDSLKHDNTEHNSLNNSVKYQDIRWLNTVPHAVFKIFINVKNYYNCGYHISEKYNLDTVKIGLLNIYMFQE